MDKAQLRSKLQTALLGVQPEQREAKSRLACDLLVATEQFQSASTIMLFLSLPHEIETAEAILATFPPGISSRSWPIGASRSR